MEAVAWLAGEAHSDHPACVCPVLGAFVRSWNDSLDDAMRQKLKPFIPRMVSTSTDGRSEERAWMCLDWLTRECAPAFMDLTPALQSHGAALRVLPEITSHAGLTHARPVLKAARAAARAAAWDAARAAAGAAARAAAWDAARAAAGAAAWDAARAAATDAAGAAAWDAARAAARAAGGKTLAPVVATLQDSAFALLDRMCKPAA